MKFYIDAFTTLAVVFFFNFVRLRFLQRYKLYKEIMNMNYSKLGLIYIINAYLIVTDFCFMLYFFASVFLEYNYYTPSDISLTTNQIQNNSALLSL